MRRRAWPLVPIAALWACNAITGAHDRQLDETTPDAGPRERDDAGTGTDAGTDAAPEVDAAALDAAIDANSLRTIQLTGTTGWRTPNGAVFATTSAGVDITSGAFGHEVVVPMPTPALPTSNYTLLAKIDVRHGGEFGIITRVNTSSDSGSGLVFGSTVSNNQRPKPFLARMAANWAPTDPFVREDEASYDFVLPSRYLMKLVARENVVAGKIWREGEVEPSVQTIVNDDTPALERGRGFAFYEYVYPNSGSFTYETDVTYFDMTITYEQL